MNKAYLDNAAALIGFERRRFESDKALQRRIELALTLPVMGATAGDIKRIPGIRRVETPRPGHVVIRIPWWYPWKRRTREMVEQLLPVVMLRALEYRRSWW